MSSTQPRHVPHGRSTNYRRSTRLSAPRTDARSSRRGPASDASISSAALPPSPSRRASRPNAARVSRSSKRRAQMRKICDDTLSAVARYSSMSWIPAANASRVGANPRVTRERRAETVEGVNGGSIGVSVEDTGGGGIPRLLTTCGSRSATMARCDGSSTDVSMALVSSSAAPDDDWDGS